MLLLDALEGMRELAHHPFHAIVDLGDRVHDPLLADPAGTAHEQECDGKECRRDPSRDASDENSRHRSCRGLTIIGFGSESY